jgi:alpha-glucosidase (family GH31 glycosyl hydrolase)
VRRPLVSIALALAAFAAALACNSDPPPPAAKKALRTVDLGDAQIATLYDDGSWAITRDGTPLIGSPAGRPLLARWTDADAPAAWHDPEKPPERSAFVPVAPAGITFESAAPGVLHVAATGSASLVDLAATLGDEFLAGTGERFDHVDPRGQIVPMQMAIDGGSESGTNERHVPIPLLVSSRGWALFVESRESGAFDVGKSSGDVLDATFEGGTLDAWIFVARDPLAVVAEYNKHVGLPRKVPREALAPMYWRNEWTNDGEALGDAQELRKRHIPTTSFWIDNPWQTSYNDFTLDPARFANAAAMMDALAAQGFRPLAWSTPYLDNPQGASPQNPAQARFVLAEQKGLLVKDGDGKPYAAPGFDTKKRFGMMDFSTAPGRTFWAEGAAIATGAGFSAFKLDYGEDLIPSFFSTRFEFRFGDGSTGRTARAYPLGYHAAYQQALDAASNHGFLIVRASSFGDPKSSAIVIWPGDLDNGFERFGDVLGGGERAVGGLPACVVAAQSLAVSGFGAFGADTGGYRRGKPTKEALVRWAESSALSVVLQLGGGGESHAPWSYDEETATLYGALASLHLSLVPYLSNVLAKMETTGAPTVVPLPLAFPGDSGARAHADDEYLLGTDLLVAPVVAAGKTDRSVHFPPGRWVRWTDGTPFEGPLDAVVPAPLGTPVFFVREGALVPLYPPGIDTLAPATASGVVTLSARDDVEARAIVHGSASTNWDDGAKLDLVDDGTTLALAFTAGTRASEALIDLDLRRRKGGPAAPSRVTKNGVELPKRASLDDLRATPGPGYVFVGERLLARIDGPVKVE